MTSKGISPGSRLGARSAQLGLNDRRHQRDTQARLRPTDFVSPLGLDKNGRIQIAGIQEIADATDADDVVETLNSLLALLRGD